MHTLNNKYPNTLSFNGDQMYHTHNFVFLWEDVKSITGTIGVMVEIKCEDFRLKYDRHNDVVWEKIIF